MEREKWKSEKRKKFAALALTQQRKVEKVEKWKEAIWKLFNFSKNIEAKKSKQNRTKKRLTKQPLTKAFHNDTINQMKYKNIADIYSLL